MPWLCGSQHIKLFLVIFIAILILHSLPLSSFTIVFNGSSWNGCSVAFTLFSDAQLLWSMHYGYSPPSLYHVTASDTSAWSELHLYSHWPCASSKHVPEGQVCSPSRREGVRCYIARRGRPHLSKSMLRSKFIHSSKSALSPAAVEYSCLSPYNYGNGTDGVLWVFLLHKYVHIEKSCTLHLLCQTPFSHFSVVVLFCSGF